MMRINLNPPGLWPSLGFPMQQGVIEPAGRRVHLTGQVAWDAEGHILHPGDAGAQTHAALDNVARVLAAAGGTLDDLVSMTTYLVKASDWPAVSAARAARFKPDFGPVSTAIVVEALADPALLVELECIAVIPDDRVAATTGATP
ncbi:hypothetical protein JANAI62_22920 [Jannaschia pagri]|uniref:Enamine deaminase RidA, house cleaning of reactive enamine intermediates, YjgF/YER057c/UK114 family n=1 Tax=Jannaschia pagri TaxID=2829797 RepID=A0ABQ4NN54_9RHOB|nr:MULTISPECIES: RidA family protein [unclassified Jannaschia]GIT91835.1 hypothetical protein JANAI61_22930 [Jannaschia sp. AI_61]GIT95669.1 hypothetical protein JANAI62_22920 [Jannaschia sp. AI_62]